MSAKLRRPWSIRPLSKAHHNVTVFLAEEYGGKWYPVMEVHENCLGMTHKGCTVLKRCVSARGYDSMLEAEEALSEMVQAADRLTGTHEPGS